MRGSDPKPPISCVSPRDFLRIWLILKRVRREKILLNCEEQLLALDGQARERQKEILLLKIGTQSRSRARSTRWNTKHALPLIPIGQTRAPLRSWLHGYRSRDHYGGKQYHVVRREYLSLLQFYIGIPHLTSTPTLPRVTKWNFLYFVKFSEVTLYRRWKMEKKGIRKESEALSNPLHQLLRFAWLTSVSPSQFPNKVMCECQSHSDRGARGLLLHGPSTLLQT